MGGVVEFWACCKADLPEVSLADEYTVRRIGNDPVICRRLLDLIACGEKTGTFSLPRELQDQGIMPRPGDFVVLVDTDDQPGCLIRMDVCEQVEFQNVDSEHLACEGPGARDIKVWRAMHQGHWASQLAEWGEEFRDNVPILFQRFTMLKVANE